MNATVSRLRALGMPVLLLGGCVAAIFLLRAYSLRPRVTETELMQAEMNRQFDTFQAALTELNAGQLEMQNRMLQAERIRMDLSEEFARSQQELERTQRALQESNTALLTTQVALRRMQTDYDQLLRDRNQPEASRPVPPVPPPDTEKEVAEKAAALEQTRRANTRLAEAVAEAEQYFSRLWSDYVETGKALTATVARLHGESTGGDQAGIEAKGGEDRPAFSSTVTMEPAENDVAPRLSPTLLKLWFEERIALRSDEALALHRRLTEVNHAIETTSRDLVARQRQLAQAQSALASRKKAP